MSRLLAFAATAALTLSVSAGSVVAQDFRALARQDLQAARDELAANHPAPAIGGATAQSFNAWLDTGLQDALGKVGRVNSGSSHAYLLRYYAEGFRDFNITARASYDTPSTRFTALQWPGIATGWRNGEYVVTYVQPGTRGAPPVGAVVTECNLTPIEDFAQAKLDRWEADLTTEAGRVASAPYLLWNRNNPFANGLPSTCKFRVGRRERDYTLAIVPMVPAQVEAAYRATLYTPTSTPLSIETVNGRPWINVHSFADDAGWEAFSAALESQTEAMRGPQGFVLDLRGGGGASNLGSSARGYGVLNRLWTPEYTSSRQPTGADFTYRATPGNRTWFSQLLGRMQADARFVAEAPQVIAQTQSIVAGFDEAIAAGQPSFTRSIALGRVNDEGAPNPVQGPVIVLVDAGCSGGCLDTVDLLSRLSNVRIAGTTTAADSIFIEQTVTRLPSNYADLTYGHKAWVSRERANNQPFAPTGALAYTGNPTDETAVRTWVGGLF